MDGSPEQEQLVEPSAKESTFDEVLSADQREVVRLTKGAFTQIERVTQLMTGYPPGHPMVEEGLVNLETAFNDLFAVTDRLTLQVFPHWMEVYQTKEVVWETEEPKDYCFCLNRDGVYLLHFLSGVSLGELKRLVEVFNQLVDVQDLETDAVTLLFDAGFQKIFWEAIDESLAKLAGVESLNDDDTPEEQSAVEELFEDAFNKDDVNLDEGEEANFEADFEVRLKSRANRHLKLEVGSRQFLELSEEAQEHLLNLKRGFSEHNELEHRQGEVLSAVLGSKPRRKLRKGAIKQIGKVMAELLETTQPWEALAFLKLIHQWRDKFHPDVAGDLKQVVKDSFTENRVRILVRQIVDSDKAGRRSILQMFDSLGLQGASQGVAELLARDLDEGARQDLILYVHKQARRDIGFVGDALISVPGPKAGPLVDLLVKAMPRSRSLLVAALDQARDPELKVDLLSALRESWDDPTEIRDKLVPLISDDESKVRIAAARSLGEAAPHHVYRVLEPHFTPKLAKRPDDEVAAFVKVFVSKGRQKAVDKLEELVRRRGMVSEEQIELAVTVVKAMIKSPTPPIMKLLESVAGDWLVASRIRQNCKDAVELLK